jgi:hypothetical protein
MRGLQSFLSCFVFVAICGCDMPEAENFGNTETAGKIRETLLTGGETTDEGPASTITPTGWATLKGKFTVDGQPRPNTEISITGDAGVCKPGGAPVYANTVVVGPDKGLANTLIYVRKIPETWLHEDAKKVPTDTLVYDQKNCVFLSPVTAVHADRKILLKNSDPVGHNTSIQGFANPLIQAGGTAPFSFGGKTKSVPIPISCSIHPWMKAWIIPLGNNYFDVTGNDGKFEIKNLPAGVPLEIQVWQEATGGLGGVSVTNPNVKNWSNKGRFEITLTPDKEEELEVTVPASVFN